MKSEITYKKIEVVWDDQLADEGGNGIIPVVLKKEFPTLEDAKKFIDDNLLENYTICLVI